MNTATVEIVCVGNAGKGYINANCLVQGCDIQLDHEKKEIIHSEYEFILMKEFYRKDRVNYCRFEIPDGAYCNYCRTIQIKPRIQERKWFRIENGKMIILGDVTTGLWTGFALDIYFGKYKNIYRIHSKKIPFQKNSCPIQINIP
jgi:hypothetical protein